MFAKILRWIKINWLELIVLVIMTILFTLAIVAIMPKKSSAQVDVKVGEFQAHEGNYITSYYSQPDDGFALKDAKPLVQYQVSVKGPVLSFSEMGLPIDLVGAFTDYALWEVAEPSAPFKEHNYKPEMWFEWTGDDFLKGTQVGFRHVSTGESDTLSAGWNRLFIKREFIHQAGEFTFSLVPDLWFVLGTDENTDNINDNDHTGFFPNGSLLQNWGGKVEGLVSRGDMIALRGYIGRTGGKLELECDLIPGLNSYVIYANIFRGQYESLLSYDEYRTGAGVGVALKDW